jgi:hypothetical protein
MRENDQRYIPGQMVKTTPPLPVVTVVDVEADVLRTEPAPMQIEADP